jgi:hypothetical protein
MHAHNKRASKHTSQNWIEVKEERNRCDDLLSVEIFHCYKILNTISQLDPNITHTPPSYLNSRRNIIFMFAKIDPVLDHKTSLHILKKGWKSYQNCARPQRN